jgi:hypothetical protein
VAAHDVEDFLAIFDPATGAQLVTEHDFATGVMRRRPEYEPDVGATTPTLATLVHAPPGQRSRDFNHVLLRVAAVYAERVQLEQLARVILIQASRPSPL